MNYQIVIAGLHCHRLLDTYGKAETHSGKDWPSVSNQHPRKEICQSAGEAGWLGPRRQRVLSDCTIECGLSATDGVRDIQVLAEKRVSLTECAWQRQSVERQIR